MDILKINAALLSGPGKDWEIQEIELGDPVTGEVQVQLAASGLCHSDHHLRTGVTPVPAWPVLGGHEGAGVVTKIGPGVAGLAVGDHVVLAFIPACGTCPPCSKGMQNLCDMGAGLLAGKAIADGTFRVTRNGDPVLPMCLLGTFAPYVTVNQSSVVRIEKDIPLDKAALLGCGVSTGWGSATAIGGTRAGDTVVVAGVGGIGINAVQGARAAGARFVVAVDPVEFKRTKSLELGATHAYPSIQEALEPVRELSWGRLADVTILCSSEVDGDQIQPALDITGKGGSVVVTALGGGTSNTVEMSLGQLTLLQKRIQGALFGGSSPRTQIPRLLNHYRSGSLDLDSLITRTYKLDQINEAYDDMLAGRNIRGLITYPS